MGGDSRRALKGERKSPTNAESSNAAFDPRGESRSKDGPGRGKGGTNIQGNILREVGNYFLFIFGGGAHPVSGKRRHLIEPEDRVRSPLNTNLSRGWEKKRYFHERKNLQDSFWKKRPSPKGGGERKTRGGPKMP